MSVPEPRFGEDGLVPAVAQDATTGRVLMLAYMNRQAWDETLRTGRAVFWSRSRSELWRKGDTSGSVLHVRGVRLDCDSDAVLLAVDADGPACHTGEVSCFFTEVDTRASTDAGATADAGGTAGPGG